ncbi:O-antigen ligase family protein [Opitutus terrae]|uniref:O-antigen ligase-related domain-containing protein n=1 Tax=Opitutus terrae (strain DSM 11246 / JCM 15787 / PB90-1) TaxID=452637 RepID=B1ZV64_OPITP|nr:O-antigen ligase family protein [Opitutus terrae]ACB76731.1 hypothetical protein Oter_3454 [Opitutus terrae PB90-1]
MNRPKRTTTQAVSNASAVVLILLWCAPILYVPWWVHIVLLATALALTVFQRIAIGGLFLVGLLPLAAVAAEFINAGASDNLIGILGFWLPQVSVFSISLVVFHRVGVFRCALIPLCAAIVAALPMAPEAMGVYIRDMLPNYQDRYGGMDSFFMQYGSTERLRALFGEASTLSATLVLLSLLSGCAALAAEQQKVLRAPTATGMVLLCMVVAALGVLVPLSKAGVTICVVVAPFLVVAAIRFPSRERRLRVIGIAVLLVAAAIGFTLVSRSRGYLEAELAGVRELLTFANTSGTGTGSRLLHWRFTLEHVTRFPFGAGFSGVSEVFSAPAGFSPNAEMLRRIPNGVYGMMNAFANVCVQSGVIGVLTMGALIFGGIRLRVLPRAAGVGCLRCACFTGMLSFLLLVETYYFLSLLPLLWEVDRQLVCPQESTKRLARLWTDAKRTPSRETKGTVVDRTIHIGQG